MVKELPKNINTPPPSTAQKESRYAWGGGNFAGQNDSHTKSDEENKLTYDDKEAQMDAEELHRGPLGFIKAYLMGAGGVAVVLLFAVFGIDRN